MRMYVWSVTPKWLAVAHANSVAEARKLLLRSENVGESGDGSCIVRDAARRFVLETEPTHWMGPNAEFTLSDSAELEEQEAETSRVQGVLDGALSLIERMLEHVDCSCSVTVEAAKFIRANRRWGSPTSPAPVEESTPDQRVTESKTKEKV